jgi:hypothetical protein
MHGSNENQATTPYISEYPELQSDIHAFDHFWGFHRQNFKAIRSLYLEQIIL